MGRRAMQKRDLLMLGTGAMAAHPLRTVLSVLGIAIGVGAVILLTSIGEGTRRYILDQFTQFGTNILAINPGKIETHGIPGVLGGTTHKLDLDDAEALGRLPGVLDVVPIVIGQARVEVGGKGRSVLIYGTTSEMKDVLRAEVRQGSFLPPGDPRRRAPIAVLGSKLKRELLGDGNAVGSLARIAGMRFRVIGVMAPKGQILGFDMDDLAFIPAASAMDAFNLDELIEIDLTFAHASLEGRLVESVRRTLTERHGGNEDFTLTTQSAMLEVFGNVMSVITLGVAAIAGISLLVGAIGILTMMWISVGERTREIGLMRAIGATARQVERLFLAEASILAGIGGGVGLAGGLGIGALLRLLVPGLPVHTPLAYVLAALAVSLVTGLLSGVLPARRAARLDPIEALAAE
ncbi:MAG: ABC transporter permease [Planctomycetota bacterium]